MRIVSAVVDLPKSCPSGFRTPQNGWGSSKSIKIVNFQRFRSVFDANFYSETPRISTSGRNLGPPTSQGRHMGNVKSKGEMRVAQSVSWNAPKAVSRPHTCSDTFWHTACTVANRAKQGRNVAPATPKRSDASQNIAKRAPPGGAGPNFFRCEK